MLRVGMVAYTNYMQDARVRRYAEYLASRGDMVDVLCLNAGREKSVDDHHGVNIFRIGLKQHRGSGIAYIFNYMLAFLLFFIKLNNLHFFGHRFDVLHIHNMPDFLVLLSVIQRLLGVKVVLDIHDLVPEVFQSKFGLTHGHWMTRLLRLEEALSCRFCSAVIAANDVFRDRLVDRGVPSSKISVVINAPDDRFFEGTEVYRPDGVSPEDFHIMYVGTLAERYGVDFGIRAIAALKREGALPTVRFSIFPKLDREGGNVEALARLIDELSLGDVVRILQPLPHEAMPAAIRGAHLLLYTPTPDVHMDIALPLKVPEFIAVGRAVVASRLSILERYFGEEALYFFEPGNLAECCARILSAVRDPASRACKIRCAQARLDAIRWSTQRNVYCGLLDTLTGAKASTVRRERA